MEFQIFTVCDFAQDYNGKLTIIGTFENISVSMFPWVHPSFAFAAKIILDDQGKGHQNLTISLLKANGESISPPVSSSIDITKTENRRTLTFCVNFGQVSFPEPGQYSLLFKLGEVEKEYPITLNLNTL